MAHPPLQIVDENDQPSGQASMAEAHKQGLVHRVVNIFVEDTNGRILLQKRSAKLVLFPNTWDSSVGGHVDAGEGYLEAAQRETKEEIGLDDVNLEEIGYWRKDRKYRGRQLNRFFKIYKAVVPAGTPFKADPDEISELRWFELDELKTLMKSQPEQFTNELVGAIKRFYP